MQAAPLSRKLVSIQFLRGIAAASVLFGHAQAESVQMSTGFERLPFDWGGGVDVFFVVSGFIMLITSHSMYERPGAVGTFLRRRAARVVPLYWLYTTLMLLAAIFLSEKLNTTRLDLENVFSSFAFFPDARWDGKVRPLLSLGWTLNYEVFFYLLFSATLVLSPRRGFVTLMTTLLALAAVGHFVAFPWAPLEFWTDPIILEFAMGAALGYAFIRFPSSSGRYVFALLCASAGLIYAVLSAGPGEGVGAPRFLSLGLPAALMVAAFVWGLGDRAAAWLRPVADWLGESSYSLYLSHPFALGLVKLVWPFGGGWAFVAVACLAALVGGVLAYLLVERPLIAYLRPRPIGQSSPVAPVMRWRLWSSQASRSGGSN